MKAAATASAVGLLAFGAVAGSGGAAFAGTGPGTSVTACSAYDQGVLAAGLFPNCTAGDSTIDNPTSLTITINASSLTSVLSFLGGLNASWTLSCVVDGSTVTKAETYDITSSSASPSTTINLQSEVGSPEPNSCTVSNLKVTSLLALGVLDLTPFSVGVSADATTAVPGAVYQSEGKTAAGASAVLCADDTGNRNAGTRIQSYQCLSDLADYFVQTSSGQLVHNGDCMAADGGSVTLATCNAGARDQEWSQSSVGGELRNQSSNTCLTATSAKDGVQLQVRSCDSKSDQKWHIPLKSAAV